MKVYKLKGKMTELFDMSIWSRIAQSGTHECTLKIDEDYYIDRYADYTSLYYVHTKSGQLVKVCVYDLESEL